MLNETDLRNRATATIAAGVHSLLEGEYDIEPGAAANAWDPILKRHTFTQPAAVWRSFDEVRITVSPSGEVIAFSDRNRFLNAVFQPLTSAEIVKICWTAGIVGPAAEVSTSQKGSDGMLVATIVEPFPDRPKLTRASINPSTRQLAAFNIQSGQ